MKDALGAFNVTKDVFRACHWTGESGGGSR